MEATVPTARAATAERLGIANARVYRVVRFCRATRREIVTEGVGLTHDEAHELASGLRDGHRADEDAYGFGIKTAPIAEQAALLRGALPAPAPLGPPLPGPARSAPPARPFAVAA